MDDSAVVRKMICDALAQDPQIEVVGTAPDPYVARDKIKELNPDVLTLDIEMPRMDGVTMLTTLKEDAELKSIPVIMLTAESGRENVAYIAKLGVRDYLVKPFQDAQLIEKVKRVVTLQPKAAPVTA